MESKPTVTTQTADQSVFAFSSASPSPPPEPVRSGPVPTRPLALGEILDGAVSLLRLYPGPTIGLAAVVMTVQLLLTVPIQFVSQDFSFSMFDTRSSSTNPFVGLLAVLAAAAVTAVITGVCAGVVAGMNAVVVGAAALGQRVTAGKVWAEVRPKLWQLIGLSLVIGLATAVGTLFFYVGRWPVASMFALAVPAMMLERTGVFRGIKRGWDLTFTGFVPYLRILGIRLLAVFVAWIWQSILALPLSIAAQYILTRNPTQAPGAGEILLAVFLAALGAAIAGIVAIPFLGCVDGLLYTDRRMRAEGFDIDLGQRLRRGVV